MQKDDQIKEEKNSSADDSAQYFASPGSTQPQHCSEGTVEGKSPQEAN